MRPLHLIALLLCLLAPSAFAERLYQVELLVFRQAGEPVIAPKIAPDDWAGTALPIDGNERATALNNEAAKLNPGNGYQVLLHKAWSQTLGMAMGLLLLAPQQSHTPLQAMRQLLQTLQKLAPPGPSRVYRAVSRHQGPQQVCNSAI